MDPLLAARVAPTSSSASQRLAVLDALRPLLPEGLPRGTTISLEGKGSTSLALALIAGITSRGHWCAVSGMGDIGVCAAAEAGVDLGRLAIVANPGSSWAEVAALLLEGADALLLRPPRRPAALLARRLSERARARRSLLMLMDAPRWPAPPDLRLQVEIVRWEGCGPEHRVLGARLAQVTCTGRRGASRSVDASLWLPSADGTVVPA
jgi:hypothetical protein